MMSEAQISALVDRKIEQALKAPLRLFSIQSVTGIARGVFYNSPRIPDSVSTTNATETEIKNITVEEGETGLLDLKVIGLKDDGSESNIVHYLIKYLKTGGALTIDNMDSQSDLDTAGAAVAVVDDGSDNISIRVTGAASTNIDWDLYTEKLNKTATALP
jgi:hypothetical protein